jgi:NADPH-dependent ferric siderophore reductase
MMVPALTVVQVPGVGNMGMQMSAIVSACVKLNAKRIRITFSGADVAAFLRIGAAQRPGNWIKLFVPTPAGGSVGRAYTLRTFDLDEGTFVVDFVIHKTGAVSLWAQAAKVGDAVTFAGPRDGGFNLLPDAKRLLLIGDSTALSAIQAILTHVPPDLPVEALIVVEHPAEHETLVAEHHVRVNWICSAEDAPNESGALEIALNNLPASLGHCQVWMAGESRTVVAARKLLSERWTLEEARIYSKIYWKRGTSHFRT